MNNPRIKIAMLAHELKDRFGVKVSKWTFYRARRSALKNGGSEYAESYNRMYAYVDMVRLQNPGFVTVVQCLAPAVDATSRFQRFFLSFLAQKLGFLEGCRPFIGIDGCHLKGPYERVLLCATAVDANFGIFLITFGVAESENEESWGWFVNVLAEHIDISI